jgi:hypothetical protein
MSFKDVLNVESPVRFYTEADPYFYTVDNRPLEDLDHRDNMLADELDRRLKILDVDGSTSVVNTAPSGWLFNKQGIGHYTITHGLNIPPSLISVLVSAITNNNPVLAYVSSQTYNSFTVKTVKVGNPVIAFDARIVGYISTREEESSGTIGNIFGTIGVIQDSSTMDATGTVT